MFKCFLVKKQIRDSMGGKKEEEQRRKKDEKEKKIKRLYDKYKNISGTGNRTPGC